MFSDETSIEAQPLKPHFVRRRKHESLHPQCIFQTVKHPTKAMFWSSMSSKGPGRAYVVQGTMKQDQYKAVLEKRLIPQLKDWFGDDDCIFMQDGAPCHTAKSVMKFLEESKINVLKWPGNSPDLNPIENLWAIAKKRVQKLGATTKNQVIENFIKVWHHDPDIVKICITLIESMPKRIEMLIKNNGYHTKY